MNEKFLFEGKLYKSVPVKDGEKHCEKCAFDYCRECEYVPEIPECDRTARTDGKDVYFIEAKTNFDRITKSPKTLAEFIMYALRLNNECDKCFLYDDRCTEKSFSERLEEWLNEETEE